MFSGAKRASQPVSFMFQILFHHPLLNTSWINFIILQSRNLNYCAIKGVKKLVYAWVLFLCIRKNILISSSLNVIMFLKRLATFRSNKSDSEVSTRLHLFHNNGLNRTSLHNFVGSAMVFIQWMVWVAKVAVDFALLCLRRARLEVEYDATILLFVVICQGMTLLTIT